MNLLSGISISLCTGMVRRLLPAGIAVLFACGAAAAPLPPGDESGEESPWIAVPLRVRNLTFPTVLVMGFRPSPAFAIPAGEWVMETDLSLSNNFQMSSGVKEYLKRRGGARRPLSFGDVEAILATTTGDQFFIDGELTLVDVGIHHGLTDTLGLSLRLGHMSFGGGILDSTVWHFHRLFGFGQQGRQYAADDHFQVFFHSPQGTVVFLDRPTSGGFTDPVIALRWTPDREFGNWRLAFEGAAKIPLGSRERLLSTGSPDFGVQATAERRWDRDALVVNLALVAPGSFKEADGFEPPRLPSLSVAWVHRLGRTTTGMVQVLFSDNIFREVTQSRLAEFEFQLTAGIAWDAGGGRVTFAVTENLFNYDNTPDIGVHLGYTRRFGASRSP